MNFFFRLPKFRKKIRPLLFCFFNRQEDCLDEPLGTYQVSRGIHVQGKLCNSANSLSLLLPRCKLDILFSSNRNVHKSLCSLCLWASDPLIDRFY